MKAKTIFILPWFFALLCVLLISSCGSVTGMLSRKGIRADITMPVSRTPAVSVKADTASRMLSEDSPRMYAAWDEEYQTAITTMELDEVTVTAASRHIPERAGKVTLDFMIRVPSALLNRNWQLRLTPVLRGADKNRVTALDPILLTGSGFRKTQQKGYAKYAEYLSGIVSDSIAEEVFFNSKAYHRACCMTDRYNERFDYFNGRMGQRSSDLSMHAVKRMLPAFHLFRDYIDYPDKEAYISYRKVRRNRLRAGLADYRYNRDVRFPYEEARLDTEPVKGKSFTCLYRQEVNVREGMKKLTVHLDGLALGRDESVYRLPASDTLVYYVSSMLQMIDETPRYVTQIISRYETAELTADLQFAGGKSDIDENLGDNKAELARMMEMLHSMGSNSGEMVTDSIVLTAGCSPEGAFSKNRILSKQRADKLAHYLRQKTSDADLRLDTLLYSRAVGEDWDRLCRLVSESDLSEKSAILALINGHPDADQREALLRLRFPKQYRRIRQELYPKLRAVHFRFHMHRRDMVQDTIHTTVPDTLYARGVELLKKRRYREALSVLEPYADYNTAVCLMSLGYDRQALEILDKIPSDANTLYLSAILYTRLGEDLRAADLFLKCCNLDTGKWYRGALDPEIHSLIIKYQLQNPQDE